MTLDPQKVVERARAQGEPQLAEWLQREVDDQRREKQLGRLKVAFYVLAFWLGLGALLAWGLS